MLPAANSKSLVELRPPNGADDVFLCEAGVEDRRVALALVARLTALPASAELTIYDFEALLLHLHASEFGDAIQADARCTCGERVDIAFRLSDYLAGRVPALPAGVGRAAAEGWFEWERTGVEFRLPTIGDQLAVSAEPEPAAALVARCVRPPKVDADIEQAFEALAPLLSDEVQGTCPHCAQTVALLFDVPSFVLRELRVQASRIYEDVHLLASRYHWTEEQILALPRRRRQLYVERLRAETGLN